MISAHGIRKKISADFTLGPLDFSLQRSTITGMLGQNGAGKTSTIKILLELSKADEGAIRFDDMPLPRNYHEIIGFVPEERSIYKSSTAEDNIFYLAGLKGVSKKNIREKLSYFMKKYSLPDILRKKGIELSKGNQQLVQILTVLVSDPQIIFFDEPYSGLDPFVQKIFNEILLDLRKTEKIILVSTHLLDLAQDVCDSVILLDNGRQVHSGKTSALLSMDNLYRVRMKGKNSNADGMQDYSFTSIDELRLFLSADAMSIYDFIEIEHNAPSLNKAFMKIINEWGAE